MKTKRFLYIFSLFFIILGLIIEPFSTLIPNFYNLLIGGDGLITDYFIKGSMGVAFINAGLVGLIATFLMDITKAEFSGANFPSVMLAIGFSLFGKNILNIWPILLGSYLYGKINKVPYKDITPTAFLVIALAPFISEILFNVDMSLGLRLISSTVTGILIGYLIFPIKEYTRGIHKNYIVYNMGLANGLLGVMVFSVFASLGYTPDTPLLWDSSFKVSTYIIFFMLFLMITLLGIYLDKGFSNYIKLLKTTGKEGDYIKQFGFNTTLINIGLTSLFTLFISFILKFPLNGPVLGSIITLAGFCAYGEHIRNVSPLYLGVFLASLIMNWNMSEPSPMITLLLMAGFSPIVGSFGLIPGVIAGFITACIARLTGSLHGGLVLYNTGFAVGIASAILVPIFSQFFKDKNLEKNRNI